MKQTIEERSKEILANLLGDTQLQKYVMDLPIPKVYQGSEGVWLIILGQDPTIRKPRKQAPVTTVLNLNHHGSLRLYLTQICNGLGLDLDQHIYATNYLKNFFVRLPTEIKEIDVFEEFSSWWLPLLQEELAEFPLAPVITLGQPLLASLVCVDASPRVRDYWGYMPGCKRGERALFRFPKPEENSLSRVIFPFPHQPSIRKQFYRGTFGDYIAFVREKSGLKECSYPIKR